MKLWFAIWLFILAGLLASCCGLQPGQEADAVSAAQQQLQEVTGAGSPMVVLQSQNPLPVIERVQEGYFSCWAATAEMIMEFIGGVRVRQCVQAGRPMHISLCCDENWNLIRNLDCDSPNLPEFGRWGYDFSHRLRKPLDWNEITAEIDGGRPFAFSWTRTDPMTGVSLGTSHMMVVVGYNEGNGEKALLCLNPRSFALPDYVVVPLADYSGQSSASAPAGRYIHEHDYFLIRPSP